MSSSSWLVYLVSYLKFLIAIFSSSLSIDGVLEFAQLWRYAGRELIGEQVVQVRLLLQLRQYLYFVPVKQVN